MSNYKVGGLKPGIHGEYRLARISPHFLTFYVFQ